MFVCNTVDYLIATICNIQVSLISRPIDWLEEFDTNIKFLTKVALHTPCLNHFPGCKLKLFTIMNYLHLPSNILFQQRLVNHVAIISVVIITDSIRHVHATVNIRIYIARILESIATKLHLLIWTWEMKKLRY